MSTPPTDPVSDAPDPSVVRAERRLRLLEELTEIGMDLARGLRDRVQLEPPTGKSAAKDPADAFGPLSRAIRLTLALEARTDEELRDLKAGVVRVREEEKAQAAKRAEEAEALSRARPQAMAFDRVHTVIQAEVEDAQDYEDLFEALSERLESDEAYEHLGDEPLREVVERLCHDLGLTPDWSQWDGDDWSDDYRPIRARCSPYNRPSSRPLFPPTEENIQALALGLPLRPSNEPAVLAPPEPPG